MEELDKNKKLVKRLALHFRVSDDDAVCRYMERYEMDTIGSETELMLAAKRVQNMASWALSRHQNWRAKRVRQRVWGGEQVDSSAT